MFLLLMLASCSVFNRLGGPEDSQTPEIQPTTNDVNFGLADLAALSPGDILLQHDYEPGLLRPELWFEYGRVPQFTLYADGQLIYVLEEPFVFDQTVMLVQLTKEEAVDLVQQVLDMGFGRLEAKTEDCIEQADGEMVCTVVMDASTVILRSRLPTGALKEVRIYNDQANHLEIYRNITNLLSNYSHENAELYRPHAATLFIRPVDPMESTNEVQWPFDNNWLSHLNFGERGMIAVALTGENLTRMLNLISGNSGEAFFILNERSYGGYLVPWLPGKDHNAAIREEFPVADLPMVASGFTSVFNVCVEIEPDILGTLRLAYVSDGDVWIWDEGLEPISLTGSGDVGQLKLSPSGEAVVFTRMGSESELWVGFPKDQTTHSLTLGSALTGKIEILSFSFDEAFVAFAHMPDDIHGELWVAHIDGSGARRLVSAEEFMSIVAEPLADAAVPAGVTWIPKTYTLTYDARPTFVEEGIYIYVQRQVWVVDALTGMKGELFAAGEGGSVSYSPDGNSMVLATPESLRLMNVEAKDLHPAGVDFFAVGFGEFYAYPPMVWLHDSQSFLLAQPEEEGYDQDLPVTVWQVPLDGSPAEKLLELTGFFQSFSFSPSEDKVAYWRTVAPGTNVRELHIAALDGSEHILYATEDTLEFLGWIPDFRRFVYGVYNEQRAYIGDVCGSAVPLQVEFYPVNFRMIDFSRFLFERPGSDTFELYEGHPDGSTVLRLNIENFGGYDFVILPPEG